MTKTQPATLPVTTSLDVYLATLSPAVSAALAVSILSVAAMGLTSILWGFFPAPRWVAPENRRLAKRATSASGALLLAIGVPSVLPGSPLGLRVIIGLAAMLLASPLYDIVAPLVQAKTGLKLPTSLPIKGDSDE
jgi:hypothetical protein